MSPFFSLYTLTGKGTGKGNGKGKELKKPAAVDVKASKTITVEPSAAPLPVAADEQTAKAVAVENEQENAVAVENEQENDKPSEQPKIQTKPKAKAKAISKAEAKAASRDKSKQATKDDARAPRRHDDGDMLAQYTKFVKQKAAELVESGSSKKDARKAAIELWHSSDLKRAYVAGMSESERKRRKFI